MKIYKNTGNNTSFSYHEPDYTASVSILASSDDLQKYSDWWLNGAQKGDIYELSDGSFEVIADEDGDFQLLSQE